MAWPLALRAQQPERMRRIGVLMNTVPDDPVAQAQAKAFQQGLQQLDWTDGRNVRIDYRWTAGDLENSRSTRRSWSRWLRIASSPQTPH